MKVRKEDSSTIVSTIKYILDELFLDLHSPSISTKTYNGTRHMLYNSSTKWNSEYLIENSNALSEEKPSANEYGIMLVSEFLVDDGEYTVSDFHSTNHTLKPIARSIIGIESNESQVQEQEFENIDTTTETIDENEDIDVIV